MSRVVVAVIAVLTIACGGSPSAPSREPSAPGASAPPPTPPVPTAPVVLTGRVTATNDGRPLDEVTVAMAGQTALTDRSGMFRLEWPASMPPVAGAIMLSGRTIVSRSMRVAIGSSEVALDAIFTLDGFNLDYYRQLVRDGFENPTTLQPIRRWTRAPMIYLKTIDEGGAPIDAPTLEHVAATLGNDTGAFTGDRLGIAGIERGTGSREGASGWITVKWPNPPLGGQICGRAQVAVDGGWIELNYLNPVCHCGGTRIGSGTVRHEMGHAFGFYHADGGVDELMVSLRRTCQGAPSKRERLHAAIAYSRPVGNVDPDNDPPTGTSTLSRRIIVLP